MKKTQVVEKIIDGIKLKNIPLTSKKKADKLVEKFSCYTHASKVDDLSWGVFLGKNMHDDYSFSDSTYWSYADKKVETKIEDNKKYKVWYTYRDAADPCDMTTSYRVYYVEEIPQEKVKLIESLEKTLKNLYR